MFAVLVATVALVPTSHAKGPAGAYDRAFLTDMIGHHTMAVDMAEMAREKATHPELKKAAEDIIRTQSAEIDRMRRWLRDWYGVRRVQPELEHHEMLQMGELEEATGAEFEIRFLALMSVHHTQAIERASVAIERAKHRPVRKLARAIVKAQEGEIEQFRDWLVAWYAS
ncbi:MAG: DUF305 domain-containing protein [Thermoleophilaceae bacterium]|nr:DUF305 domain-containing protein [Thermoleophilaceae bacterium]